MCIANGSNNINNENTHSATISRVNWLLAGNDSDVVFVDQSWINYFWNVFQIQNTNYFSK